MPSYRTPGVYVQETSTLPPSVAEVESAIPAFIGYTEKATKAAADDLRYKPTKILSFAQYQQYFGAPDAPNITVTRTTTSPGVIATAVVPPTVTHLLYYAVNMFFDNGGGKCYVVSVGDYDGAMDIAGLMTGLDAVALEDEPTLLVCPDALRLSDIGYDTMAQAMLNQCGSLKNRFAILDLFGGSAPKASADLLADRARVGNKNLKYGALYFPDLQSSFNHYVKPDESNVLVSLDGGVLATLHELAGAVKAGAHSSAYDSVKDALLNQFVVVPPSGAVAGVYAAVDSARGVWKAPANVRVASVVKPMVVLNDAHQEDLSLDLITGKSINALRAFADKGTLVWGARTLAGNDPDWRYVPVRRFFNMVEESVKKSSLWAVFEPNDANTWGKVRGMIENYLTQKWRDGALAGAKTNEAFFVRCGLGDTMTAQDILEGRMNVEIGMAPIRAAEFIILQFSHEMQKPREYFE